MARLHAATLGYLCRAVPSRHYPEPWDATEMWFRSTVEHVIREHLRDAIGAARGDGGYDSGRLFAAVAPSWGSA